MDEHDGIGPGVITYSVDPNSTPEKKFAESNFREKSFTVITKVSTLP
jgi:hypothetical protein